MVLGHRGWVPGQNYPIHFILRSFDGRKTWQEWKPAANQGRGPITEGAAVQLRSGRILIPDVYAEDQGTETFLGKMWESRDGLRTIAGPSEMKVTVPGIQAKGYDDRGAVISRLYIRRSVIELKNGDLLACAYGKFRGDTAPVEYIPKMLQTSSYLIRSQDGGRSWSMVSMIARPPAEQEGFGEPVIVQIQKGPHAGRLVCQMRTGREHPVYQATSDDVGVTWSKPRPLRWTYSRFGRQRDIAGTDPDLAEMSDGKLVMSYGHKPDYMDHGNFVAFSLDGGDTWENVTRVSSELTMAYTGVREVAPGELFAVYTKSPAQRASQYKNARFDTYGRSIFVRSRT